MEKTNSLKIHVTRVITFNAVIAALYATLTVAVLPLAYGPIQFRFSECFTVLPVFFPSATIGLTIGCFVANLFSSAGVPDIILGTAATLVAGVLTTKLRKLPWALLPPILINAFVVPVIFIIADGTSAGYWFNVLTVGAGQAAVIAGLGIPLYFVIQKNMKYLQFVEHSNKGINVDGELKESNHDGENKFK